MEILMYPSSMEFNVYEPLYVDVNIEKIYTAGIQ
jgi:hypothetical protein